MNIPCMNCEGAGCAFCNHVGHHTLNKSRRHRAAPQTKEITMTTTDAALLEWAAQQTWSSFATDVASKGARYGLTVNQRAALERMKAKVDAKTPGRPSTASVPGFQGIVQVLDHIDASGNKFPRVTLTTDAGGKLVIRRNRAGRGAGQEAIKLDDLWLGNITPQGDWGPSAVARDLAPDTKAEVWSILKDLRDDAIGTLEAHGKKLGRCSCCGRALSNDESVEVGIGPECRAKLAGLY